MIAILFCALANVTIFICFRMFHVFKLNTFHAIVFNYCTCVITGLVFIGFEPMKRTITAGEAWLIPALLLGFVFIGTFYLMARTTQVYSITVASIATKMSLVIPVLFSLLVLKIQSKEYTIFNYAGILLALVAIVLSSIRKNETTEIALSKKSILLPISIFLLGGFIDSAINYLNHFHLERSEEGVFPIIVFSSAALTGLVSILFFSRKVSYRSVIGGVSLGIVNYFSMYFLLKSLSEFKNDGAIVYPLLNVTIILGAALASRLLFSERFSLLNLIGLAAAVVAILLLSHQSLFV